MRVHQAPTEGPKLDPAVVAKLQKNPDACGLIAALWDVAQKPTPEQRAAQFRRKVLPKLGDFVLHRDDLRARLEQGWDELGPLPDEEPVGRREAMWMSWLADYEAVCTVLAIAEEIRIGKVIAWDEVRP